MTRFSLMSRIGLAEPLVRLARAVERSNRAAAAGRAHAAPRRRSPQIAPRPGSRPV